MTVRQRLAMRLRSAGYAVEAADIVGAKGYWRHVQQDCAIWEAHARRAGTGLRVKLFSYATMTRCVRAPRLTFEPSDFGVGDVEVDTSG